ncbi:MAG: hypothetical protein ABIL01_27980 [Pseudomonadota bacterium]
MTGRICAIMVQRPSRPNASGLRNQPKQRRSGGRFGQRRYTGIAGLRSIRRAKRNFSVFGHVSQRFACEFNLARRSLQHPVHILRYGDECIDNGYLARINQLLTSSGSPPELAGLVGTDLAHTLSRDTGTPCQEP